MAISFTHLGIFSHHLNVKNWVICLVETSVPDFVFVLRQ